MWLNRLDIRAPVSGIRTSCISWEAFNGHFSLIPTRLINENEVKQWRDQAEKFRKGEGLCLNLPHALHTSCPAQLRIHLPLWRGKHTYSQSFSQFLVLLPSPHSRTHGAGEQAGEEGARMRDKDIGEGRDDADAEQDEGQAGPRVPGAAPGSGTSG